MDFSEHTREADTEGGSTHSQPHSEALFSAVVSKALRSVAGTVCLSCTAHIPEVSQTIEKERNSKRKILDFILIKYAGACIITMCALICSNSDTTQIQQQKGRTGNGKKNSTFFPLCYKLHLERNFTLKMTD